jgi:hypothetical protein
MTKRTVRDLHDEAMQYAMDAHVARDRGDMVAERSLAAQALLLESEAASMVDNVPESEPTRSILYLSAASLAMQAGEIERMRELIAEAWAGSPSPRTAAELRRLEVES